MLRCVSLFFRSKRGHAPVDIPPRLLQNLDKLGSEVKRVWVGVVRRAPTSLGGPVELGRGPMTTLGVGGMSVTGPTQLCEVWRNGQLVPLPHHGVLIPALALPSRME